MKYNVVNIHDMQMNTLSEELSLMLSCLRESQLQATRCHGVTHADSAYDSARHVDVVRRRYDVCFTRAEWRMTEEDGQIGIADLLLANFLYTKLNYDNDSGYHQLELGAVKVEMSTTYILLLLCNVFYRFQPRLLVKICNDEIRRQTRLKTLELIINPC